MPGSAREGRHDLTVHVKRDDAGWVAYAPGLDGAVGSARRLEDATTQLLQRAAKLLSATEDELDVEWTFEVGPVEQFAIEEVRHYQNVLADAQMEYNHALYRTVRQLHEAGYTDR